MNTKSGISNVGLVAQVSSNISGPCEECGANLDGSRNWVGAVNHYLGGHGYELLHVGQESSRDDQGEIWQFTIAVVGKHR